MRVHILIIICIFNYHGVNLGKHSTTR